MQCTSKTYPTSFVVTDPKGSILIECGKMLQKFGYRIRFLNTINMKKSMHYRTFTTSVEVEILDHEERKLATLAYRWDELAPLLRGMYVKELDGFFQDPEGFADRHTSPLEGTPSYHVGDQVTLPAPDHPITGTIDAIEDTTVRIYTGPYAWSYGGIYPEEIAQLQKDYAALWEPLSDLLKKLSAVTAL